MQLTDRAAIGPMLSFIVGPPAVGKMAVGHEIAQRTGLRLFHNHVSSRSFDSSTSARPPVRINNTHLSPEAVADLVITRFELPVQ